MSNGWKDRGGGPKKITASGSTTDCRWQAVMTKLEYFRYFESYDILSFYPCCSVPASPGDHVSSRLLCRILRISGHVLFYTVS